MRTEPASSSEDLTDDDIAHVLSVGSLRLIGRLAEASNASFLGQVQVDGVSLRCIYKPVAGERPLWDFLDGTLGAREMAARLVSEAGGWQLVPPTVMRDGRFGPGVCQRWVDVDAERPLVDVVAPETLDGDWIAVLEAEDMRGRPVLLAHADDVRLRDLAVLDVVINNADRKGSHVLPEATDDDPSKAQLTSQRAASSAGRLWACDHGVTFHASPKLRTVLWGWASEPLRDRDRAALEQLLTALDGQLGDDLARLLAVREVDALRERATHLLTIGVMPVPDGSWPPVPWPAI